MISRNRIVKVGRTLLLVGASCFLLVYLIIAIRRVAYPFELEWMEGGSVVHVQRVMQGQPLYGRPSLAFVPYIYTPFYFYVSSLLARITGIGFLPLRLVSLLASLGCFGLIYLIVHRRTSSRYASFLAAFLFAASYRISGSWFDIARVDTLFLFTLLAGVYTFDSPRWSTRAFISPAFLFLSFFTKQTALIVGVSLAAAAFFTRERSERFWFPAVFGTLLAGSYLIMNSLTDGWYGFYAFYLPAQHDLLELMFVRFWTNDIARNLSVGLAIGLIPFLRPGGPAKQDGSRLIQDVFILGGFFLASYLPRIHAGGFDNVLMPVFAGIAIYFGIGWAESSKAIGQESRLKLLTLFAAGIQFAALVYPPSQQIPSTKDRERGEELQRIINSFEGDVYLSDHPWYLEELGKTSQAQDMAMRDIMRASGAGEWKERLSQEMAAAIDQRRYEAIIVDFKNFTLRPADFEEKYDLVDPNLSGGVFHPVAGWDRFPSYLYVRRASP